MTVSILREAASLMRSRAKAATLVNAQGEVAWHGEADLLDWDSEDAAHIAAMSPAVALAVADWLDREAYVWDGAGCGDSITIEALATAHAYLGTNA